jgi:hypothetical protein
MIKFQLLVNQLLSENSAGNVAGSGGALGTFPDSQFSGPNLYAPDDARNVIGPNFPIAKYSSSKKRRKSKSKRKIKKKSKTPLVIRRTLQRNVM